MIYIYSVTFNIIKEKRIRSRIKIPMKIMASGYLLEHCSNAGPMIKENILSSSYS